MNAPARREQLLDATKAIVSREGFHAVSIEAVAREARITRPVVYGHFGDLTGLLEALVERESERALGQLAEVLPPAGAPGGLLGPLRAYLETARRDPDTWRLVLMPPEGAPAILRERIAEGRNAIVGRLALVVAPALARGEAPPDAELTARMLSALADESARLLLTDPGRYPLERIMRLAAWLLDRLGTETAGPADRS